jgi:hypothetical protein
MASSSVDTLIKNLDGLDEAVIRCLDAKLILPGLSLVFAGIDIVASLERQPGESTKVSFTRWVDQYLLPAKPLGCTSLELYAARCGILHTFTADSDLSRTRGVRKIYYAWGSALASDLDATGTRLGKGDAVAVHVSDLHGAFRQGVLVWFHDVTADAKRSNAVDAAGGAWFTNLSIEIVKDYLAGS